MKKKSGVKAMRETRQADRQAGFRRQEEEKKALELKRRQEEERQRLAALAAADLEKLKKESRDRNEPAGKKSTAKAAGLKSTFILDEKTLLMTAFGKGNRAVPEKRIEESRVCDLQTPPAFAAKPDGPSFRIDGRVSGAMADDPLHRAEDSRKTGDDLIHCRAALENRFFGRTFEDNVHIQLIYNVLDIEKLLAGHVNNILYALSNVLRDEDEEHWDLFGYLYGDDDYDNIKNSENKKKQESFRMFRRLALSKQMLYYGIQIIPEPQEGDPGSRKEKPKQEPNTVRLTEREFFSAVCLLSGVRHMLAHGGVDRDTNIYRIEGFKRREIPELLARLYRERVNALNGGFLDKAKKNLTLLFDAFGAHDLQEKRRYVRDYYDFTVRKTYKNQGFSVKKLRETMTLLLPEAQQIRDQQYDTVRQKVNAFFDFALYQYYEERPREAEDLVSSLRACMGEDAKLSIYCAEARRVWPGVRDLMLGHVLPKMNGNAIKDLGKDPDVNGDMLADVQLSPEAMPFTEMIWLLTFFLNGKEINDLLTGLVSKLENIGSFLDVLKDRGLPADFLPAYAFFADSWKAAEELRAVNSFARMRKENPHAKAQMFVEAARVLGYRADEEELRASIERIMDTGGKKPGGRNGENVNEMGVRNFIANNVIDTPRFRYLARYANVGKVSALAKNRPLVAFVLKDIPDAQILRYWNACEGKNEPYGEGMRADLAERIASFSFEDLSGIRNKDGEMNREEQERKRSMQALVRLYLTVLYLAVKNLVNVNSRYFLAFHCVERDRLLYDGQKWNGHPTQEEKAADPETWGLAAFARDFLRDHPQRPRVQGYLGVNFANSDDWAVNAFRNKVEHLDAVRNLDRYIGDVRRVDSWFDLYHYVLQRALMDQFTRDSRTESKFGGTIISEERLNPKTPEYFGKVRQYRACCRDFVKALCVPFCYNLPRYKNLTIDGLFDRNRPGGKGTGKTE